VWIPARKIWDAICHIDTASNRSRGFMTIAPKPVKQIHLSHHKVLKRECGFIQQAPAWYIRRNAQDIVEFINNVFGRKNLFKQPSGDGSTCIKRIRDVDELVTMLDQDGLFIYVRETEKLQDTERLESPCNKANIVGVVHQYKTTNTDGKWGMLCVSPEFSGTGFGSMLMDIAEINLIRRGSTKLHLVFFNYELDTPHIGMNYINKGYTIAGRESIPDEALDDFEEEFKDAYFVVCIADLPRLYTVC